MTRILTLVILFLLTTASQALTKFQSGKQYRIVCTMWPSGNVIPGASAGRVSPVSYDQKHATDEHCYWTVERHTDGSLSFRNVQTGKYLTWDGKRSTTKYQTDLTERMHGDSSRWVVTEDDGCYVITNRCQPLQRLNVRTGSYIVGTYSDKGDATDNERFILYDEDGQRVFGADSGPMSLIYIVQELTFDGKPAVYDSLYHTYMLPLTTQCRDDNAYKAAVAYRTDETDAHLFVEDTPVENGTTHVFKEINGGRTFRLSLRNDSGVVATASLTFTFLPIIELTGSGFDRSTYKPGTIRVHEPNNLNQDPLLHMKARYRGATASGMKKKSYAIKLTDAEGNDLDYSFLGLRSDNNWILDAMAIDPGRMRNRISTDLWNDFATPPYHRTYEPKALHGTRGRFVEIMMNGRYAGLYCFTEKMDRKQLRLKKYDTSAGSGADAIRGCLYKSAQWSYSVFMGADPNSYALTRRPLSSASNYSDTWDGWELKYPDRDDGEAIDWSPLRNAANIPATGDDLTFRRYVARCFDLPVVRDYYLFISLIVGRDNDGKNMYWYTYDKTRYDKLSLAPWDMDGTWGRNWDGSLLNDMAEIDFSTISHHALFKRLRTLDYNNWNDQLARRYAELRATEFQVDKLYDRFVRYKELFDDSGATERELKHWNGANGIYIDLDAEMTYMKSWITRRLDAMDRTYGYINGIGQAEQCAVLSVQGGRGELLIHTAQPQQATIYTTAGIAVRTVRLTAGTNRIEGLQPGIYIVGRKKAVVE